MTKKIILWIAIVTMPIFLNFILQIDTPFGIKVIGDAVVWLQFWGTYLSTLISLLMAYVAFASLNEMKKQTENNNRPFLAVDVVMKNSCYFLRIRNCGNKDAYNVKMSILGNYNVLSKVSIKNIRKYQEGSFFVPVKEHKLLLLESESQNYSDLIGLQFTVKLDYCDRWNYEMVIKMDDFVYKLDNVVSTREKSLNERLRPVILNTSIGRIIKNAEKIIENIASKIKEEDKK